MQKKPPKEKIQKKQNAKPQPVPAKLSESQPKTAPPERARAREYCTVEIEKGEEEKKWSCMKMEGRVDTRFGGVRSFVHRERERGGEGGAQLTMTLLFQSGTKWGSGWDHGVCVVGFPSLLAFTPHDWFVNRKKKFFLNNFLFFPTNHPVSLTAQLTYLLTGWRQTPYQCRKKTQRTGRSVVRKVTRGLLMNISGGI